MPSDPVQDLPAQAVEAAAKAIWSGLTSESFDERLKQFPKSVDVAKTRAQAERVLAAALPHLRQQIADEFESSVEYGHQLGRQWTPAYRGIKYASHQRTVHYRIDEPVAIDHWTYTDHRHPVEGCTHPRHDLTTAAALDSLGRSAQTGEPQ